MQLFRRQGTSCQPIEQWLAPLEQNIHELVGANLQSVLGIRLIGHEVETQHGRMDTLGIDALGGPVIIEFKRGKKDNVINQALSYQLWLDQHRERFSALLGANITTAVDWSALRIICIAASFTEYDKQSISLFKANIDLMEYRLFGEDLLLMNTVASHRLPGYAKQQRLRARTTSITFEQMLARAPEHTQIQIRGLIDHLEKEHPELSIPPFSDALELSQQGIIARITLQGSTALRIKASILMTPQELKEELDPSLWPGLETYRQRHDGFDMSLFDVQSINAFTSIIDACIRLKERSYHCY